MTAIDPLVLTGKVAAAAQRDVTMLAHDVRSALHGVLGGVALLEGADLAPQLRDQVDRIGAAGQALSRLVGELIGEEQPPERCVADAQVDLQRFLRHMARRWSGEALERNVRFRIEAASDLPATLNANFVSLGRALGNLVGNSVKHACPGDLRLILHRGAEGGVVFEVIDDGPGFPTDVLERTARPARAPEMLRAHGHGLHIAQSLCELMGGSFELGNLPYGGARVALSFPAELCGFGRQTSGEAPDPLERLNLGGLRVLLAEDNLTNQMVAVQMLTALNVTVTLTSDGVEALERFESEEFDMVVVDIEMPRMSGLDVIRAIRARSDARAKIPIVALTAYAMREHRDRIAAAGANGLISKPITSVEALGAALRDHMVSVNAPSRTTEGSPGSRSDGQDEVADLAVFDALCAAIGLGMMAELLDKVVADLLQARADLAGAISPLDRGPIRSASHILISVAGAIGANRLQSCARSLNVSAHGDADLTLPAEVQRCVAEIDAAVAFAQSRRVAE